MSTFLADAWLDPHLMRHSWLKSDNGGIEGVKTNRSGPWDLHWKWNPSCLTSARGEIGYNSIKKRNYWLIDRYWWSLLVAIFFRPLLILSAFNMLIGPEQVLRKKDAWVYYQHHSANFRGSGVTRNVLHPLDDTQVPLNEWQFCPHASFKITTLWS